MTLQLLPDVRTALLRSKDGRAIHARLCGPRFSGVWVASGLLFAISPLLAPGSVSQSALLSMLPFAAILALAAVGQTLVIQQRGLDLSVPGMITLTTIIVMKYPNGSEGKLPGAIGLIVLACVASGLISGLALTRVTRARGIRSAALKAEAA